MRVLIVDDTGFVAGHLIPALEERFPAFSLCGMSKEAGGNRDARIEHLVGDVRSQSRVGKIVRDVLPDIIINLSLVSSVFESWGDPVSCHQVNYLGTLNICLAMIKYVPEARLLHISSLEVYGGNEDAAVCYTESSSTNPQSPYAVSKAASELLVRQYGTSHGLRYTVLRPANHTGPGRKASYALRGFAKQLAEIKQGLREPVLRVGNLRVYRDFLDVRDVVEAYTSVITQESTEQEIFNLCSGNSYCLSELLHCLIDLAGVEVETKVDPKRYRPVDAPYIRGGNLKIKRVVGWYQKYP